MGQDGRRRYSWYKHHAWAALAMLSLFFAVSRFIAVPAAAAIIIVIALGSYALVAIAFTYRHNTDNISPDGQAAGATPEERTKDWEKREKKRLKAEAKLRKKEMND